MTHALTCVIAALVFALPVSAQDPSTSRRTEAGRALEASGQVFPTRPVRFIVPFSTGGATDTLARALGRKLNDVWGQPVVVENRQGAAGNIGMEILSKATPDGYTLAIINSSVAINPSVFRKIAFDIVRDFTHIALLGHTPSMLVAHPGVNVTTVRELTDLARAHPGKFSYGSCGNGTPQHFAGELYRSLANVNIVHVPYRGCAPALTDVLGEQVTIAMINGSLAAPQVKSGKLRGLAMTSRQRSSAAPEVPTFAESGYKDFEMSTWYGMTAPRGVPRRITEKIFPDIMSAMKDPGLRARLQSSGVEEMLGSGAEMTKLIAADVARYAVLVKQANIKVD